MVSLIASLALATIADRPFSSVGAFRKDQLCGCTIRLVKRRDDIISQTHQATLPQIGENLLNSPHFNQANSSRPKSLAFLTISWSIYRVVYKGCLGGYDILSKSGKKRVGFFIFFNTVLYLF